jgi:hypothetical protein
MGVAALDFGLHEERIGPSSESKPKSDKPDADDVDGMRIARILDKAALSTSCPRPIRIIRVRFWF